MKLTFVGTSGLTLAATIERLADGYFREDDTETFVSAPAFADKDVALTEGTSENVGSYTVTLDPSAWSDGLYRMRVHNTGDSNKTIGASMFAIKGGYEVSVGEESGVFDIYHADINMVVDAANTQDEYEVTWYKNGTMITSGITSPTIQVVKRSDGSDLITSDTMIQVASTGTYRYDGTTAASKKQTAGELYRVIVTASIDSGTRTWSRNLGRDASA